MQRAAAGADERELRIDGERLTGGRILHVHPPALGGAIEVGDLVAGQDLGVLRTRVGEQLARQRAEVDVGAGVELRQRVDLAGTAVLEHQRQPLGLHGRVVGVLHLLEQRVAHHRLVAGADVVPALLAPAVGDVRNLVDEGGGIGEHAFVDEVRPELARDVELLIDVDRLGDVDVAVGIGRRVVELAQRGVAGAGVVPRVRAFAGDVVEALVDADIPLRLELSQQRRQRGAHDAAADEDDVGAFLRVSQ